MVVVKLGLVRSMGGQDGEEASLGATISEEVGGRMSLVCFMGEMKLKSRLGGEIDRTIFGELKPRPRMGGGVNKLTLGWRKVSVTSSDTTSFEEEPKSGERHIGEGWTDLGLKIKSVQVGGKTTFESLYCGARWFEVKLEQTGPQFWVVILQSPDILHFRALIKRDSSIEESDSSPRFVRFESSPSGGVIEDLTFGWSSCV